MKGKVISMKDYISTWDDCRVRLVNDENRNRCGFIEDKCEVIKKTKDYNFFVYKYETGAHEFYIDGAGFNEDEIFGLMWDYVEGNNLKKCDTDPDDIWTLWK